MDVSVLQSGRAHDPFLAACAWNIWYVAALQDIDLSYVHVLGKNNRVADLLSRWTGSRNDISELNHLLTNSVWLHTSLSMLELNNE